MGKGDKKKGSFWKEAHIKATPPDQVVEEQFPTAQGLRNVYQQPAGVGADSLIDVSALGAMVTNDILPIQKQTDSAGELELFQTITTSYKVYPPLAKIVWQFALITIFSIL